MDSIYQTASKAHISGARQHFQDRETVDAHAQQLASAHEEISEVSSGKMWGSALKIGGAFFMIAAAGKLPEDYWGGVIRSVSSIIGEAGNAKIQWDDNKISRMQGILEEIRHELQRAQGNESDGNQKLRQLEDIIAAMIKEFHDQQTAANRNR